MTDVERMCAGLCSVSLISGILLSLMPENRLTSSFRALTAILILHTFLSVAQTIDYKDIKLTTNTEIGPDADMSYIAQEQILEKSEKIYSRDIEALLAENGYDCDFTASIDNDSENIIQRVVIFCVDEATQKIITEILTDRYGEDIIIEFSG